MLPSHLKDVDSENYGNFQKQLKLPRHLPDIRLARPKRDHGVIPVVGDGDNSLSMRWVKLGSTGCMNHADGARGGRHVAATGWIFGVEKD